MSEVFELPEITSLDGLADYLSTCSPLPLCEAALGKHFYTPECNHGSAYRDGTTGSFFTTIFGRIQRPVSLIVRQSFEDWQRTFRVDCPPTAPPELQIAFQDQLYNFAFPVKVDDIKDVDNEEVLAPVALDTAYNLQTLAVFTCTDAERSTATGGLYMEVHVDNANGERCIFHEVVNGTLKSRAPRGDADWLLKEGDWVVLRATLHRTLTTSYRSYYVVATDLRIAHLLDSPSPASPSVTASKTTTSGAQPDGVRVMTRAQKRKAESGAGSSATNVPATLLPLPKKARKDELEVAEVSASPITPVKACRRSARMSTGGSPPKSFEPCTRLSPDGVASPSEVTALPHFCGAKTILSKTKTPDMRLMKKLVVLRDVRICPGSVDYNQTMLSKFQAPVLVQRREPPVHVDIELSPELKAAGLQATEILELSGKNLEGRSPLSRLRVPGPTALICHRVKGEGVSMSTELVHYAFFELPKRAIQCSAVLEVLFFGAQTDFNTLET
ncbi:hypothetical protein B0H17DRAFT_1141670 [Mycena rosella]|uniref:Uncharacterized protein n=1 Tax=Mycena rosella TaxID=1033263 RepID=A0AAD7CZB3_MYCRO|nr:hypothetical protein B0H17DRAFT_1141670 [Mycena rosella]